MQHDRSAFIVWYKNSEEEKIFLFPTHISYHGNYFNSTIRYYVIEYHRYHLLDEFIVDIVQCALTFKT